MAELAANYAQTVTAENLAFIQEITVLDTFRDTVKALKRALPVKEVPETELWRIGLLDRLLILPG